MSEKRSNNFDPSNTNKKIAVERYCNGLELLPSTLIIEIFNYLKGNDLKNLFLVSKKINYEIKSSRKLMNKLVLNLENVNWMDFNSTKFHVNIKAHLRNIERLLLFQNKIFHPTVESSLILKTEKLGFRIDGLKNDERVLMNLVGLKIDNFKLTSAGNNNWKLISCQVDGLEELEKFLSNVDSLDFLEDFTILEFYFEDRPLFLSTLNKMITSNFRSLKRLEIKQKYTREKFLKIAPFLSNIKATLKAVYLCGQFDTETYMTVINELPNLKSLALLSRMKKEMLAELDSLNLEPNHTVENLSLQISTDERNISTIPRCFIKMTNVKVFYIYEMGFKNLESTMDSMKKLSTVHLLNYIYYDNACMFKSNIFPNVKTLRLSSYFTKEIFRLISKSFPSIEKLIIYNTSGSVEEELFDLKDFPRRWKSLKHLELDHVLHTTISSFIKLLKDYPKLKTVVVSPEAFFWKVESLDSDREVLKNFMKNGLQLFAIRSKDDQKKMTLFDWHLLKAIEQDYSLSSGVKINI